ncbi:MAG: glycosyltransferase family 39 protein, partial [Lentisphaeria bacterium]|nr:glycosyltransferase family 39 protein [Lentisphaeria bacterium]
MKPFPAGKFWGLMFALILVVILANVLHPYLWGPDEPREAEIARESLVHGNWVVPRFNQIPYVEKPPLYYDLVAAAFKLHGGFDPGAARMVSAVLGILMLAALGFFAWKKLGDLPALTAVAICISMPQFYRAAHWILLDIGVGAFVTAALAAYGFMTLDHPESNSLHGVFFLCAAAAFLTKGTVAVVYLGMVILPYLIYKRRWLPCRMNWTLLFFLLPVGIWLWLFYREGGVYYLHEHFINNIFGRLLHKDLHLEGSPVMVYDVGNSSPWSFYLERLPNMFGAAAVLIPLILAESYRIYRLPFFSFRLPARMKKTWDFLTAPTPEVSQNERDVRFYLLCWTFAPILFFS